MYVPCDCEGFWQLGQAVWVFECIYGFNGVVHDTRIAESIATKSKGVLGANAVLENLA